MKLCPVSWLEPLTWRLPVSHIKICRADVCAYCSSWDPITRRQVSLTVIFWWKITFCKKKIDYVFLFYEDNRSGSFLFCILQIISLNYNAVRCRNLFLVLFIKAFCLQAYKVKVTKLLSELYVIEDHTVQLRA